MLSATESQHNSSISSPGRGVFPSEASAEASGDAPTREGITVIRTHIAAAGTTAALLVAGICSASGATTTTTEPPIRLVAATSSVTLDSSEGEVYLNLPTHVVAGRSPFEFRVTRQSYAHSVAANRIVNGRPVALPRWLAPDFTGLPRFLHLKLTDAAGRTVLQRQQAFCPNGESARTRPDAPDRSPYPEACSENAFTLGGVWGIQQGWATMAPVADDPVKLANGKYTATVTINKAYRDMFGIPEKQATAVFKVTVRTGLSAKAGHRTTIPVARANPARPTGRPSVPKGPKPDLRSLPAWGIGLDHGEQDGGHRAPVKDYLHFSANVWNAGPSPLVLDGFRRSGQDLMDAYQYFYNDAGTQVGYAKTGTMEWDARDGHTHWHFTDFASYRLLNAQQNLVVRNQKEAFCLANTDAIDYTVKNANWRPSNTDLHTACGDAGSLSVREVLEVGSGDTYDQTLPGQSFDVSDLPNGTYYIQVIANPDKRLHETTTTNNIALRKVILGGTPGHRTVKVPPVGLIDVP